MEQVGSRYMFYTPTDFLSWTITWRTVAPAIKPTFLSVCTEYLWARPLTVLYWWFWNFARVFVMRMCMWFDIIVILFLSLFPHCELSQFSPSLYRQWIPLVSATLLIVLYRLLWNIACVFFMEWGCACLLGVQLLIQCYTNHFGTLHIFFP